MSVCDVDADRDAEHSKKSDQKVQKGPKKLNCTHSVVSNKRNAVKRNSKNRSETFRSSNDVTDISHDTVENSGGESGLSIVAVKKNGVNDCDIVDICGTKVTETQSQNKYDQTFNRKAEESDLTVVFNNLSAENENGFTHSHKYLSTGNPTTNKDKPVVQCSSSTNTHVCSSLVTAIAGSNSQKLLCNNNQSSKSEFYNDSSSEECKNECKTSNRPNIEKRSSEDKSETFRSSNQAIDVIYDPVGNFKGDSGLSTAVFLKKDGVNYSHEVSVCGNIKNTEALSQNENDQSFDIKVTERQKISLSKENSSSVKTSRTNYKLPQTDVKNNSANELTVTLSETNNFGKNSPSLYVANVSKKDRLKDKSDCNTSLNIENILDSDDKNQQFDATSFSEKINESKEKLVVVKEFFLEMQILLSKIVAIIDECKSNNQQEQTQTYKYKVNDEKCCTRQFLNKFKKGLPDGTELKNFKDLFIRTRSLLLKQIVGSFKISNASERIKFLEEFESDCSSVKKFLKDYCKQIVETEVFIKKKLLKIKESTLKKNLLKWNGQVIDFYKNIQALCRNANQEIKTDTFLTFVKSFSEHSDNMLSRVF